MKGIFFFFFFFFFVIPDSFNEHNQQNQNSINYASHNTCQQYDKIKANISP